MKIYIKLFAAGKITTLLLLLQIAVKAQVFPAIKHPVINLRSFTKSATIIYDLDSVKFYFDKTTIIRYLKKEQRGKIDSNISFFLNALHANSNLTIKDNAPVFNKRTGELDMTVPQNIYQKVMNIIVPSILLDGKAAIYDCVRHVFVNRIHATQEQSLDFLGYREVIKLYYIDKRLFYSIEIRRTIEEDKI